MKEKRNHSSGSATNLNEGKKKSERRIGDACQRPRPPRHCCCAAKGANGKYIVLQLQIQIHIYKYIREYEHKYRGVNHAIPYYW